MSFLKNIFRIDGDGNISIVDVNNSTINIGTPDEETTLNVVILSATLEYLEENKDIDFSSVYGQKIEDWRPFKGKTIIKLLEESAKSLKATLSIYSIASLASLDSLEKEQQWAYLKYRKNKTILIVDAFCLNLNHIQPIANFFNDYHIGGCIVIETSICKEFPKLKISKEKVFNHLNLYLNDEYFYKQISTPHLHIENVDRKSRLMRNLLNTAVHHLKIRPRKIKSQHEISSEIMEE